MRFECCPGAVDLGRDVLRPLADSRQNPGGGRGGETPQSSRHPTAYISQKMPKIHPRGPFTLNYKFVD